MKKITVNNVIDLLKKANARIKVAEGDIDVLFKELGFDSLDKASLFLNLEEYSGVPVADKEFVNLKTIAQVVDYVNAYIDSKQ